MNADEILSHYPGCELAIAWVELLLDDHSAEEVTALDEVRRYASPPPGRRHLNGESDHANEQAQSADPS